MRGTNQADRTGLAGSLAAGLATGAATGLIAAILSAPLRRWAGVGDRALVNGASMVGLSIGFWLAGGLFFWLIASRTHRPLRWLTFAAIIVGALTALAIYTGAGPSLLTPYPARFPSLAVPLIAVIVLGGAALYPQLLSFRFAALTRVAGIAAVAALVAGGLVYAFDRQGTPHYALTTANGQSAPARAANPALTTPSAAANPALDARAPSSNVVATPSSAGGVAVEPESATPTPAPASAAALHFAVAQGSEVSYTVTEKLAQLPGPSDAIGKSQTISGDIWLTPQGLDSAHPSSITVDLRTLKTDNARRDQYLLNNSLQSNTYPYAVYTITGISGFPSPAAPGQPTQPSQVTLTGTFAVHNQQKPITWTGTAVYNGSQIEVVLSTQFDMSDFGITPPDVGIAKAQSGVKLDAHIFATQQS
jgi:polyisoprenoid-binding protein YceI